MNDWVWGAVGLVAIPLLIDLAARALTLCVIVPIFESRPSLNARLAPLDRRTETVRFPSTDQLRLTGGLLMPTKPPRGLIVFCPEFGGTRASAAAYLDGLLEAGFAIFSFDFRNQGESDHEPGYRPTHWLTEREVADVAAALGHIAERRDLRELPLALFGVSRGGNAALAAAAQVPHVKAVAAEGAFSTDALMLHYGCRWAGLYAPRRLFRLVPRWHFAATLRMARWYSGWRRGVQYTRLERALPKLAGRPVQLIAGSRDSYIAPEIAQCLRNGIGSDCDPIWVVEGAGHNQARWTAPEEFTRRLIAFYDDALGGFNTPADEITPEPVEPLVAEVTR